MLETSARLLRLLSLLQARATWTGGDLISRLEVTDRTLRRDVARLRTLGYPVHATSGRAGGYMLGAGAQLPPLMLADDEALAVALGLAAGGGGVGGLADAQARALAKLEMVMPARLRRRASAIRRQVVRLPDSGPTAAASEVAELASACADHRVARFRYLDQTGAPSERTVEPHRLVLLGPRWYLAAWDRDRRDWRTFRVDRIQAPVTLGEGFVARAAPDDDVGAYVSRQVARGGAKHAARIRLHAPLATMRARIPPQYGDLEPLPHDRCRLSTSSSSLDGTAIWLAVLGVPFEIESPPALITHVAKLAERLRRGGAPGEARAPKPSKARAPRPSKVRRVAKPA